jgi:hypothetical protein
MRIKTEFCTFITWNLDNFGNICCHKENLAFSSLFLILSLNYFFEHTLLCIFLDDLVIYE